MPRRKPRKPLLALNQNTRRARFAATVLVLLISFIGSLHARGPADPTTPTPAQVPAATPTINNQTAMGDASAALLVRLADDNAVARKDLLEQLARTGDQRLEAVFADFGEGSLYLWNGRAVTCKKIETEGDAKVAPLVDPFTRAPILIDGKPARVPAGDLKEIAINRRDRSVLRDVTSLLRLSNPDKEARLAAIIKSGEGAVESNLPALQLLQKSETNSAIKTALAESIALIQLANAGTDAAAQKLRLTAAKDLGNMRSARALSRLQDMQKAETNRDDKRTLTTAINSIQHWQSVVEWIGVAFSGLSASSILILMALGLSIIFGLMGVINMAHGELMMIGAYATYMTQLAFVKYLPASAFDWYFVVAIPISFLVSAIAGMILEATVIRFLYGRPLETLLATFGVGYILVQVVRITFGDNIGVNSPTWLRGSYEILQDVRLPYNRLFIIAFCIACIGLMYFIIERTKLGLLLRATTQNRTMAASLGVSTRKIDMLTFGLGAGLAGMAGCAITQVGGVTPDMGSNYIIDSFLVVVTGGVGKLAGAIWAGMGLGMTNKFLEPFFATVWAKVIILALVVIFIQRRPSGLFPAKGRLADV